VLTTIFGKHGLKTVELNRRKAIRERCLNCSAYRYKEIENCAFHKCPLYAYRSGRGRQNPKNRSKAIRKYCLWCMAGQRSEIAKCACPDCSLFPYRNSKIDKSIDLNLTQKTHQIERFSDAKS